MKRPVLSRREFTLAAGGALAAGLVAPNLQALTTRTALEPRNIKKAVKIGMVKAGKTLEEKFRILMDLGFQGVELDGPSDLDPKEVLRARAATNIDIHGIVCSTHWSQPLSSPDADVRKRGVEGIRTALRDAKTYGATTVLVVPAVVNKEVTYDDAYKRSQEELRKVVPLAEELGVKIAFENVWNQFLLSPLEAARYVDEFESDAVGWYFDVGNIVNYGWPEQWIRILGPRILKLDIKEFSRKKRNDEGLWKGFGVKLLEGDCDWPAVMKALDDIGYSGWATAEIAGGDETRLKEISERMNRIIAS